MKLRIGEKTLEKANCWCQILMKKYVWGQIKILWVSKIDLVWGLWSQVFKLGCSPFRLREYALWPATFHLLDRMDCSQQSWSFIVSWSTFRDEASFRQINRFTMSDHSKSTLGGEHCSTPSDVRCRSWGSEGKKLEEKPLLDVSSITVSPCNMVEGISTMFHVENQERTTKD